MFRLVAILLVLGVAAPAATKRVLYITHSAGYRHDSIPTSQIVMEQLGVKSGAFEVVSSEDLSLITAETLRGFDVLYFFTSGELALSDQQKSDLLEFVREGKGFGGVHSATDTLYNWREYGELIGAYFNGHPWAQEVTVRAENRDHPILQDFEAVFRISDEIYQFRNFSRDRTHVLLSLDTSSVDLSIPGVAREDGDFPLAWYREYGKGRVFYTALGHGNETWLDSRFQALLLNALKWLADIPEAPRDEPGVPRLGGERFSR